MGAGWACEQMTPPYDSANGQEAGRRRLQLVRRPHSSITLHKIILFHGMIEDS
jgi:hypothetical protein